MGSARWFFDVFCGFSIPDRNIDAGFTNMSCQFWELNACKCSMHGAYGCRYWGRSLSWGCLLDLRVCFTMQWNLLSVLMFLFSGRNYNRILYTCLYGSIWIYMDIYNIYSYRIYIYDQDSLHSKGMSQTSKRLLSAQLRQLRGSKEARHDWTMDIGDVMDHEVPRFRGITDPRMHLSSTSNSHRSTRKHLFLNRRSSHRYWFHLEAIVKKRRHKSIFENLQWPQCGQSLRNHEPRKEH